MSCWINAIFIIDEQMNVECRCCFDVQFTLEPMQIMNVWNSVLERQKSKHLFSGERVLVDFFCPLKLQISTIILELRMKQTNKKKVVAISRNAGGEKR